MIFYLETDHPIALTSLDHIEPRGTANDNSVNLKFNEKLIKLLVSRPISVLDLGCAGGGMVKSFVDMGQIAAGIEGSDYSLKRKRAAWGRLPPGHLFTADITKPFTLHGGGNIPYRFDAVTAWEFFEHIEEEDLPGVMDNILRHLKPAGWLFGSTTNFPSIWKEIDHHRTKKAWAWWNSFFESYGFVYQPRAVAVLGDDWVRNGRYRLAFRLGVANNG